MVDRRPFFVIVPGGSQNPAHYGYLSHLLLLAGYPVFTALLPSIGATAQITVEDDAEYIRNKMILPVLDHEERDVILVMHSYSGIPGSVAAKGLAKKERALAGKKTGVIGQINIAAVLVKGGDGKTLKEAVGGHFPPHIRPDYESNLLLCDDRIPPLYQDVSKEFVDAVAVSAMAQGMSSFTSPCPLAGWASDEYKGRLAYIQTLKDASVPSGLQEMLLNGTGVEWIIKGIDSGHSPQLSQPENLTAILVELAKDFETV